MAKWKKPPVIKVYEALGSLADDRIKEERGEIRIYSSSGNKYYTLQYDEGSNALMVNDNGSYWKGYLGYPAIAYLMKIGKIRYNKKFADALKGVKWKDINQQFKNDFDKTIEYIRNGLLLKGVNLQEFDEELKSIEKQLDELSVNILGKKTLPPKGY